MSSAEIRAEVTVVLTPSGYSLPLTLFRAVESPEETSLLLLPALGMAASFYQPIAEALARQGIHTVLMEQRGHGNSSLRASHRCDFGFREWLEEDIPISIEWVRTQCPGTTITLMGHSLGGHLATCYLGLHANNPSAPERLVLTACGTPWAGAYQRKLRWQIRLLRHLIPPLTLILGYFPGDLLGFGGREARRLMRDWRRIVPANRYSAEGMEQDLDAGITRYRGSVLGIRFESDAMAPEKATQAVLDKFTAAKVDSMLLDAGTLGCKADHFRWARHPDAVATAIANWIRS